MTFSFLVSYMSSNLIYKFYITSITFCFICEFKTKMIIVIYNLCVIPNVYIS